MDYQIELEAFKGPFEVLFDLINKEKIDIYNIPIHRITKDFIALMTDNEIPSEQLADFILFTSILLEIKSNLLLPDSELQPISLEDESDPRHQLLVRLLEYQKIRELESFLGKRENRYKDQIFSDELIIDIPSPKLPDTKIDPALLQKAFNELLVKMERYEQKNPEFFKTINIERFSVKKAQQEILDQLKVHEEMTFEALFPMEAKKGQWIASFLAILKLQHSQQVIITQENQFSPIMLKRNYEEYTA